MTKKKIRVGLFGVGRGMFLWKYCQNSENAELVAICDKSEIGIAKAKEQIADSSVTFYNDFDEFIKHDMDAVFLANYATEHAPFAIKAMEAGKDVASEVLPVQTMAQAVALIECAERTGRKYCYSENYCYMIGPYEMKKRYKNGDLGEFEYGEGEYMHNCEPVWPEITYGEPEHWRNTMSAFFYCTHSAGPLLHITGQRPVKVVGVEGPFNARMARMGAKAGNMAVEIATLENGGVIKSIHGVGPSKNSVWYSVYGAKGRLEIPREDAKHEGVVYAALDKTEGISEGEVLCYKPEDGFSEKRTVFDHCGSDYVCLWNIFEHFLGNKEADIIDVYEAIDMWMIGFFGHISAMNNSAAQAIPDLHSKEMRDVYRDDRRCTNPEIAKEQLLPSYTQGNIDIAPQIYEGHKNKWLEKQNKEK